MPGFAVGPLGAHTIWLLMLRDCAALRPTIPHIQAATASKVAPADKKAPSSSKTPSVTIMATPGAPAPSAVTASDLSNRRVEQKVGSTRAIRNGTAVTDVAAGESAGA